MESSIPSSEVSQKQDEGNPTSGVKESDPNDAPRKPTTVPTPHLGDEMYPPLLADAVQAGHITNTEAHERYSLHKLVSPEPA